MDAGAKAILYMAMSPDARWPNDVNKAIYIYGHV
jgi:hypothetical protein